MDGSHTPGAPPVSAGAASDTGVVRAENEDAYGHFSPQRVSEQLFVVADGMGGDVRGREASTTTIAVMKEVFFRERIGSVPNRLQRALYRTNSRMFVASEADKDADAMGTTATALALVGETAYIAHVGDSRAYCYRSEKGKHLTRDHTVVRELRRQGASPRKKHAPIPGGEC